MDPLNKRAQQWQRTHRRVLLSARQCFEEVGYEATTISRVAKTAKVSVGSVISHFPDKPSLVAAAFHATLQEHIDRGFATVPQVGILDQLCHLAGTLYGWYAAHPQLGRALLREGMFLAGQTGEDLNGQLNDFVQAITALLGEAMKRGEIAQMPAPLLARGFFCDYFGVLIAGLSGQFPSQTDGFDTSAALATLRALTQLRLRPGAAPIDVPPR
ncbi:MAG: TetR/AcrR family transcriptional regulator [Myxococcota bacterium]